MIYREQLKIPEIHFVNADFRDDLSQVNNYFFGKE